SKVLMFLVAPTLSKQWCPFPKCLGTQPIFGRGLRAAAVSRCTSDNTKKRREVSPKKSLARFAARWPVRPIREIPMPHAGRLFVKAGQRVEGESAQGESLLPW